MAPTDPLVAEWAARIKATRLTLGLSQLEFSRRLSVTPKAVSEWERGLNLPRAEARRRLARVFAQADALDNDGAAA